MREKNHSQIALALSCSRGRLYPPREFGSETEAVYFRALKFFSSRKHERVTSCDYCGLHCRHGLKGECLRPSTAPSTWHFCPRLLGTQHSRTSAGSVESFRFPHRVSGCDLYSFRIILRVRNEDAGTRVPILTPGSSHSAASQQSYSSA